MNKPVIPPGIPAFHIPGIDGLRALAVLSVIVFHFCPTAMPGGFCGVDIFFVISGYVVSASLAKQPVSSLRAFLVGFYARRILRIYPALVACLIVAALLQSLFVPVSWLSDNTNKTGVAAFFGLSNLALIWFNDSYFSPRVEYNLFTHTWSLAVEEQFYLLFPFLMFAWLRGRDARGAWGTAARWALPVLLVVSLGISWHQSRALPDHAYYLLPSRFWELACGAALLKLQAAMGSRQPGEGARRAFVAAGLILIGIGVVCSDAKHFPVPWAIVPVLGTVLAMAGVAHGAGATGWAGRALASAPAVYIGKISYSLYLWHWPIAVIFRWTCGLDTPPKIAAAAVLTALMGAASYRFIETPVRVRQRSTKRSHRRVVAIGTLGIVACAVLAGCIFRAEPVLSQSVTRSRQDWYPERWPAPVGAFDASASPLRQRRMFVVGDSHTDAYSTLLQMLQDREGVRVEQFAKAGCPVAGLLLPRPDCVQFAKQALAQIRTRAAPGDIVFLASLRMDRLGAREERDELPPAVTPAKRAAAVADADDIISAFEDAGLTVLIDAPKPVFPSPPFRCSDAFNVGNPVCRGGLTIDRDLLLRYRHPVMDALGALAAAHPRLVVWDPFDVLCPRSECSAFDHGQPLFFDGDHLSAHGNRVLYPSFRAVVGRIWLAPRPPGAA